jgi:hypothetical protein
MQHYCKQAGSLAIEFREQFVMPVGAVLRGASAR